VAALEILDKGRGVGRAYAKIINHASAKEFKPFFNDHISAEAFVITDTWKGYLPFKKQYPHLKQILVKQRLRFAGNSRSYYEYTRMVAWNTSQMFKRALARLS
jgi:hypothetical protein